MHSRLTSSLPWMLVLGGTFIIQYHSIYFWSVNVDRHIGWAWSLMIEASGLWLWYQPGIAKRMLGLATSILLLAGPLYQITTPALDSYAHEQALNAQSAQTAHAAHAQVRILRAEIAQDAQLVRTYAQNSQKRTGWLHAIQDIQKRMDNARKQLHDIQMNNPQSVDSKGFRLFLLVLLQAAGLILVQVSNVLAITHISGRAQARIPDAQVCAVDAQPARKELHDVHIHEQKEDAAQPAHMECAVDAQHAQFMRIGAHMEEKKPPPKEIENEPRIPAHPECANMYSLAEQVRGWMDTEGLSIAQAAIAIGVGRQNLSYLINWQQEGDRKPSRDGFERMCNKMAQTHLETVNGVRI